MFSKTQLCFVLLICVLWRSLSYGVETTDNFKFPVDDYIEKKGINNYGACDFVYACPVLHTGDDIGVGVGTKVYASADGVLKFANFMNGYGGMYVIEHTLLSGEKVCTLYAHMNVETFPEEFLGKSNISVSKGAYLGDIAPTGISSNGGDWDPHLHFAIKKGAYINDFSYYYYYSINSNEWVWNWAYLGYTKNANLSETTKSDYDVTHEGMLNSWYDPTVFVNNNISNIVFNQTNFTFPLGSSEGMKPNWSMIEKPLIGVDEWRVQVSNDDPGVDSPEYPSGLVAKSIVIEFSAKVISGGNPVSEGKVYIKDETGSWINSVPLTLINSEFNYNGGQFALNVQVMPSYIQNK